MRKTQEYQKIRQEYFTLVSDEVEYGIVTALNWYESLNLKKLATMLNKPESTTLRYIRKLKDKGIIAFDSEKSGDSWGKFYKLTPAVKQIYDEYMHSLDEQVENITSDLNDLSKFSEEELEKYVIRRLISEGKLEEVPLTMQYFYFVSNLQNVMINEAVNKIDDFRKILDKTENKEELIEKTKLSPMDISIYVNRLKISKWSHIFKINELIFTFMKQLEKLKREIEKEMDKENVPEDKKLTQFVNIFTGNLDISYEIEEN
jgi:hypothetical protein